MTANLDEALQRSSELRDELLGIDMAGLDAMQRGLVADATSFAGRAHARIEAAIAVDDELHPEDR